MNHEEPIRRHVNISARSSAQLELRLHWFTRALAVRRGYILAMLRRPSGAGRYIATVAYEMPLPQFTRPGRGALSAQAAGGARNAPGDGTAGDWIVRDGPERQAQGTSSGLM